MVGRNILAKSFLDSGFDKMLMVDTDMVFGPKQVLGLLENPAPIVGGLCFTGPYKVRPTLWVDGHRARPKGGVMAVEATGCAFLAIGREVFETVPAPWFGYAEDDDGRVVGEDVFFCRKVAKHGFKILVDCDIKPGHIKSMPVTERTYQGLPPADRRQELFPE